MTALVLLVAGLSILSLIAALTYVALVHPPPLHEGFPAETPQRRLQIRAGTVVPFAREDYDPVFGWNAKGEYVPRTRGPKGPV